jgi:hypothetical protein
MVSEASVYMDDPVLHQAMQDRLHNISERFLMLLYRFLTGALNRDTVNIIFQMLFDSRKEIQLGGLKRIIAHNILSEEDLNLYLLHEFEYGDIHVPTPTTTSHTPILPELVHGDVEEEEEEEENEGTDEAQETH